MKEKAHFFTFDFKHVLNLFIVNVNLKNIHNGKVRVLFYSVDIVRTSSQRGGISSNPER